MVTKQKHFLDSLRQMVSKTEDNTCPTCQKGYEGEFCPDCDKSGLRGDQNNNVTIATAYLVDLVSNHKIKIPISMCKVGRDESNDIVVSGDQSISRHHVSITHDGNQYFLEDMSSRHGTFLNGTQIKTREIINDGDVVKIGVSLFWFVIETDGVNRNEINDSIGPLAESTDGPEQTHVTVQSDILTAPSDPSASTMNEIPVMHNEQTLMDRLRLKTHSFDQSGLFAHAQSQPGKIGPPAPNDSSKSGSDTQVILPALDESGSHPVHNPENLSMAPRESSQENMKPSWENYSPNPNNKVPPVELWSGSTIYDQVMSAELAEFVEKYNELKQKIDEAQSQMQKIANQLNAIRALGINLIGSSDGELVNACNEVLSQLGWQISPNDKDPQELHLRHNGQLSIARIIWTAEEPERSHLGQLSISQTHHWCDEGQEPKGILVVSRLSNKNNQIPTLTDADYESELTHYAAKKSVCMMTSAQLLAIYRDLVLNNADINALREKIMATNGWLEGFTIKTSDISK